MKDTPRRSTLWPLPGGVGHYLDALGAIITAAADKGRMSDVLEVIVETHHLTGEKTAISYLRLAATLGFLEIEGGAVFLTLAGQRYLDGEELAEMTANALVSRVSACQEILEALSARPQSIAGLSTILKAQGHEWSTRTQLRYRLRWMEETGLIVRGAGGRPLYSVPAASGVSSR